jgi:hypothetical protein
MKYNLLGKRFGRLKVVANAGPHPQQRVIMWTCQCDCGNVITTRSSNLVLGLSKSCKCLRIEHISKSVSTHGHCWNGRRSGEASSYHSAHQRCTNSNSPSYKDYGGRGIQFKFSSFQEFYEHIGPRPKGMSLDRIDVNGHYEIGNVRWATPSQQRTNTRWYVGR